MFCEIMDREFSDLRCWNGHQFTVDAYASQHVGNREDPRALNSVNIHLASLHAYFEKGWADDDLPDLRSRFSQYYKGKGLLEWLDPPLSMGDLTIFELWENVNPDLHEQTARQWAESVWKAWTPMHDRVASLVKNIWN